MLCLLPLLCPPIFPTGDVLPHRPLLFLPRHSMFPCVLVQSVSGWALVPRGRQPQFSPSVHVGVAPREAAPSPALVGPLPQAGPVLACLRSWSQGGFPQWGGEMALPGRGGGRAPLGSRSHSLPLPGPRGRRTVLEVGAAVFPLLLNPCASGRGCLPLLKDRKVP